ncbi:MAG: hypothetical protein HUU50_00200 [Candidatus Brocadiae bacterium]|nr:hypothetical protein [Candidatus Brocadiia bacterium]
MKENKENKERRRRAEEIILKAFSSKKACTKCYTEEELREFFLQRDLENEKHREIFVHAECCLKASRFLERLELERLEFIQEQLEEVQEEILDRLKVKKEEERFAAESEKNINLHIINDFKNKKIRLETKRKEFRNQSIKLQLFSSNTLIFEKVFNFIKIFGEDVWLAEIHISQEIFDKPISHLQLMPVY